MKTQKQYLPTIGLRQLIRMYVCLAKRHLFALMGVLFVVVFCALLGNWNRVMVNGRAKYFVKSKRLSAGLNTNWALDRAANLESEPREQGVDRVEPLESDPDTKHTLEKIDTDRDAGEENNLQVIKDGSEEGREKEEEEREENVEKEEQLTALEDSSSTVPQREQPTNIVWIQGNGTLINRVQYYIRAISKERDAILKNSIVTSPWIPPAGPIKSVWGNDVDTIYKLQNSPIVRTVALQWLDSDEVKQPWNSMNDHRNLILQDYYGWVGNDRLCSWITVQGRTKAHWDAAYNCTCNTDPTGLVKPRSLEKIYLNSKPINPSHYWPNDGKQYPEEYYTTLPKFVFYVHIVQSGVIDGVGDVFTKDLKIVPYTCSHNASPQPPPGFMETPIYNEVFVITQYWGPEFFHKMTESIPRIAPYLDFLRDNSKILIHVAETRGVTKEVFKLLGINPWRMVTGTCRAKVVYLPKGTPCAFANVPEMQLLSHTYREVISKSFVKRSRNSVVVIRRTGMRKFIQFPEIEDVVKSLAETYGFNFELFPDSPMLSFEEAMQMFNRAVMVVGPHGAGLSNLLFSEPGTVVIEGVCHPPHVNMCYQRTAHILGHRYHGLGAHGGWTVPHGGCEAVLDVQPAVIGEVVETHMKMLKKLL